MILDLNEVRVLVKERDSWGGNENIVEGSESIREGVRVTQKAVRVMQSST